MQQGLWKPGFYGDLVYKLRKMLVGLIFYDQFKKLSCFTNAMDGINVMRQPECLVIDPVTADGFASLLNCTPADHASDSMMGST